MKIQQDIIAKKVGDDLPNGARILALRWFHVTDDVLRGFVLAVKSGHLPFVTWERTVQVNEQLRGMPFQTDDTLWGHYFSTIEEAKRDFDERVEQMTREESNKSAISKCGEEDGRNAGEWWVGAHNSIDQMRKFLQGIDDGDPMYLDQLPSPDFSGEWADADHPSWKGILYNEGIIDDDELDNFDWSQYDDLYDVYCEFFTRAAQDYIVERVSEIVRDDEVTDVVVCATNVPGGLLVSDKEGKLFLTDEFFTNMSEPDGDEVLPGHSIRVRTGDLKRLDGSEVHELLN